MWIPLVTITASYSGGISSGERYSLTSHDNANVSLNGGFGIGVLNVGELVWPRENFAVDGLNVFDRLAFAFNATVKLLSAEFFYYYSNTRFTLFTDSDSDSDFEAYTDLTYTPTTALHANAGFGSLNLIGDLFGFGAGEHNGFDTSAFKILCMTVDTGDDGDGGLTPVPVPASLPLFGTGLALLGYLGMRRRKKAKAA